MTESVCLRMDSHKPHTFSRYSQPFTCPGRVVPHPLNIHRSTLPPHDSLLDMMDRQGIFQKSLGYVFDQMTDEKRIDYIRMNILALTSEAHEALDEMGWKPWASNSHFNRDAYVGELIDVWHFLINLFLVAEVKPHELFDRFMAKNDVNVNRQINGYDGVTEKCATCRRAIDEPGKDEEVIMDETAQGRVLYWCNQDCYDQYKGLK